MGYLDMNNTLKLNVHSCVSLITNSSTEIYTDETATVEACKEMVEEFARVFGLTETFDEMFYSGWVLDDWEYTQNSGWAFQDIDPDDEEAVAKFAAIDMYGTIRQVIAGEIEKPQWMRKIEMEYSYHVSPSNRKFYITAKEPKYAALAERIKQFLASPERVCE
jgi:hypothetical protein